MVRRKGFIVDVEERMARGTCRSRAESEKKPREKGERQTERGRQEKETEWGGVSRRREQSQNSRLIRGTDSWPLFTRQDLGKWNSLWP